MAARRAAQECATSHSSSVVVSFAACVRAYRAARRRSFRAHLRLSRTSSAQDLPVPSLLLPRLHARPADGKECLMDAVSRTAGAAARMSRRLVSGKARPELLLGLLLPTMPLRGTPLHALMRPMPHELPFATLLLRSCVAFDQCIRCEGCRVACLSTCRKLGACALVCATAPLLLCTRGCGPCAAGCSRGCGNCLKNTANCVRSLNCRHCSPSEDAVLFATAASAVSRVAACADAHVEAASKAFSGCLGLRGALQAVYRRLLWSDMPQLPSLW